MTEAEFKLFEDVHLEMQHAKIFIRTREMMYPIGVEQYDAVLARLTELLREAYQRRTFTMKRSCDEH